MSEKNIFNIVFIYALQQCIAIHKVIAFYKRIAAPPFLLFKNSLYCRRPGKFKISSAAPNFTMYLTALLYTNFLGEFSTNKKVLFFYLDAAPVTFASPYKNRKMHLGAYYFKLNPYLISQFITRSKNDM